MVWDWWGAICGDFPLHACTNIQRAIKFCLIVGRPRPWGQPYLARLARPAGLASFVLARWTVLPVSALGVLELQLGRARSVAPAKVRQTS